MEPPSAEDRYSLFESQIKSMPLDKNFDLSKIAKRRNEPNL